MKTLFVLACCFLVLPCPAITMQDVIDMPANTWLEAQNTHMRDVDPCPARNCAYSAVEGQSAVFNDWNGAAVDTKRSRLICWGGGHAGYFGNEVYAFDIPAMTWLRLTDPSANPTASDPYADGKPAARHIYNGTTYIAHADRLFVGGGSGSTIGGGGFTSAAKFWFFNFADNTWLYRDPSISPCFGGEGSIALYDPATSKIWCGAGYNSSPWERWGLYSYDFDSDTWTHNTEDAIFYMRTGCIDTKRGLMVIVGGSGVDVFNIRSGTAAKQTWSTTNWPGLSGAPGADYDPVADRIVCWQESDRAVHVLDPDAKVWTTNNPPGAPTTGAGNGTYHRWSYVPSVNAFILATSVDDNVHFYKHTAGGGTKEEAKAKAEAKGSMTVSPNPAKSRAVITINKKLQVTSCKLSIFDITGKQLETCNLELATRNSFSWNASGLPAGVYIAQVTLAGRTFSKCMVLAK